jgi:hypothetical protein
MPVFYLDSGSINNLEISSSLLVSGAFTVSGSINTTGGLTGSLQGTASWATNAVTASFAPAYLLTSATSSMLAPYVLNSQTSSFVTNAQTSSFVTNSQTSSMSVATASFATSSLSASFASTASFVRNAVSASYILQAVSASFASTSSYINTLNQDVNIVSGALTVDVDSITNSLSVGGFIGNQNNYIEVYVQNLNSGVSASSDIVAYANNGSETSSFIDMGINSSGIATGYSFGNGNDAYVYNTGGNLYIGNNTAFFQPAVTQQSLFLFANASGSPDLAISSSRIGIRKTGSLNAILDISGSTTITGSLNVTQGITGSLLGTASFAVSASWAPGGGGGLSGGTTDTIPLWTSPTTLGSSYISQSGASLKIDYTGAINGFDFNFFNGSYIFGSISSDNILRIDLNDLQLKKDGQGLYTNSGTTILGDYNNTSKSTKITVDDNNKIITISGSALITSGSGFTPSSLTASEILSAGDLVNIFSGGVRKASNENTSKQAHGFVISSYLATDSVVIFYSGLNTSVSGLTVGARYFLGIDGALTTTPPSLTGQLCQEVGIAVSTTALLFQPQLAIIT